MSRPKHYWYNIVKKMIMSMKNAEFDDSIQGAIFSRAYNEAVAKTLKLPQGRKRVQAVENILVKQTATIESEAMRLYYSEKTVKNWINAFVNLCGREAGF